MVFHYVTELDRCAFDQFDSINGDDPFINPRWSVVENTPELGVVGDLEYEKVIPHLKSHDYLDYANYWDIPYGAQSTIIKTPELRVFLNSLRSKSDGKSDEKARTALARIAPKVQSAVQLAKNIEFQGAQLLSNSMNAMTKAVFICGNDGKVISYTNIAEKILIAGKILKLSDGYLKSSSPHNQNNIDLAIKAAIELGANQTIVLRTVSNNENPLILDINVLPRHDWDFYILPKLIITIREPQTQFSAHILTQMFDLSHTEAQIATLFAQGKSRQEIAAIRGVSLDTVRTQFKNIFLKTGVNREIELMTKLR